MVYILKKLWFQVGIGILLTLLIIRYFLEIKGIFSPILIIGKTIFFPLLLGGVLYYVSEPIQRFLENRKFPRWASILSIFAIIIGVVWIFIAIIGPLITEQTNNLVENSPAIIKEISSVVDSALEQKKNQELPPVIADSIDKAIGSIETIAVGFGKWIVQFLQSLFQMMFLVILVPFFFIFMLKDHEKFAPFVYNFFKGKKREWVKRTLHEIDTVLRSYIQGQLLISLILATLLLIGYKIIGLEYALLLATFALFMNVIPFIGPWIAVVPALIIAYVQDPKLLIWVGVVTLVAQQTDSNFITPNIMGKTLEIHPLTVITVILAAGNIAGFLGILIAIPAYAVGKVIVKNVYLARQDIKQAATKTV